MTFIPIVITAVMAVLLIFFVFATDLQYEIDYQHHKNSAKVQIDTDYALSSIVQDSLLMRWDPIITSFSKENLPLNEQALFNAHMIRNSLKSNRTLQTHIYQNFI